MPKNPGIPGFLVKGTSLKFLSHSKTISVLGGQYLERIFPEAIALTPRILSYFMALL